MITSRSFKGEPFYNGLYSSSSAFYLFLEAYQWPDWVERHDDPYDHGYYYTTFEGTAYCLSAASRDESASSLRLWRITRDGFEEVVRFSSFDDAHTALDRLDLIVMEQVL